MKLLTRFLTFVLSLLLSGLIIAWSTLTVLGSATTVNGILMRTKVYDLAAEQTRTSLQNQPNIPAQDKTVFATALNNALTAETMQAVIQPLLVDMIGWLNQPGETPPPRLVVNLSPVRSALVTSVQKLGLSPVELLVVEAQINQQLPDQLDIAQAASIGSGGALAISPSPAPVAPENQYMASLRQIKAVYTSTRTFAYFGLAALVLLTILVVFLSRHEGRGMMRRPAWVFLNAGILVSVLWIAVQYFTRDASLGSVQGAQAASTVGLLLAREVVAITIWYGLASIVAGGVLYGLSFFIHKLPPTTPGAKRLAPQPPTTPVQPPATKLAVSPAAQIQPTTAPSDPSSAASPTHTESVK